MYGASYGYFRVQVLSTAADADVDGADALRFLVVFLFVFIFVGAATLAADLVDDVVGVTGSSSCWLSIRQSCSTIDLIASSTSSKSRGLTTAVAAAATASAC